MTAPRSLRLRFQAKGTIEHTDFAIREFGEMKMQPSLDKAKGDAEGAKGPSKARH